MKSKISMMTACGVVFSLVPIGGAFAQTSETAPQSADDGARGAEIVQGQQDIIVTAQRRREPLQKVPIAVTALDSAKLESQKINDLMSLQSNVPSLNTSSTANNANVYIRGIGQNGGSPNNENSVAMYVDDIYYAIPQMSLVEFNNIDQLVVLKGPQGTLFGRNATGGVIQINTLEPGDEAKLDASVGYANYDTISGSFYGSNPLSEKAAINVAAVYNNQRDGWGRNRFLDIDVLKKERFSVRSKLLLTPDDLTSIRLAFDYSFQNSDGLNYRVSPNNPLFAAYPSDAGDYDTMANAPDRMDFNSYGVSLKGSRDLGFASLVSITGYRWIKAHVFLDQDTTPARIADVGNIFRGNQFTQEFQLLSSDSSDVKWTLGAFYMHATPDFLIDIAGAAAGGNALVETRAKQDTDSLSAYAQGTYPILPGTNLTAGIRFTHEKQKIFDAYTFRTNSGRVDFAPQRQKSDDFTWRLSIDHQFNNDILGYISYNRGIKSGGFNLSAPTAIGYRPEKLDAYEAGLKSYFLDRKIRLNLSAFYYNYSDIQVQTTFAGSIMTFNAAKAKVKGVDADVNITVTPRFTISGNFGILDTEYTSFPDAVVFSVSGVRSIKDVTGNDLVFSPKFSGSLAANYKIDTSFGKIGLDASINRYGGAFASADNIIRLPAYNLVNAQVKWTSLSEKYDVRLWGANLNDARYFTYASASGIGANEVLGAPRTYGVTVGVHF